MIFLVTNAMWRLKQMNNGPVRLIELCNMLRDRNIDESAIFDTLEIMKEMGYIYQLPGIDLLYDMN